LPSEKLLENVSIKEGGSGRCGLKGPGNHQTKGGEKIVRYDICKEEMADRSSYDSPTAATSSGVSQKTRNRNAAQRKLSDERIIFSRQEGWEYYREEGEVYYFQKTPCRAEGRSRATTRVASGVLGTRSPGEMRYP